MKQYLDLLKSIKEKGTYKPAARPGMPGTQSLFGYQFRHNLAEGFPLLTTKKVSLKNIAVELLWFLRGDTNIKYLVDNGCNIWNGDAYNYFVKKNKEAYGYVSQMPFDKFVEEVKKGDDSFSENPDMKGYKWGDCGFQYGRVWRKFGQVIVVDQIKTLIEGLKNSPEGRRHIVTAIDPVHDQDLALYWCHAMFQFNCRPLTDSERAAKYYDLAPRHYDHTLIHGRVGTYMEEVFILTETEKELLNKLRIPKYYLDCQLYQRSADTILGVPYNIASYCLLTEIIANLCNMVPGEFIHTFGDVHIYDNHKEAVEEQLTREPKQLPKLVFSDEFHYLCDSFKQEESNGIDIDTFLKELEPEMFRVAEYDPYPAIKAELSTGV